MACRVHLEWKCPSVSAVLIACLTLASLCFVSPALAADDDDGKKFEVHGFLTQAIATADFSDMGPTAEEITIGIPDGDWTTDYRFLALQFRYQVSSDDIVIVQLSSRSLGNSPINQVEDDIELDWAFYERALGDNTSVKIGRIQIPLGIFNETRDVGTLLPFYRPTYVVYGEGTFTSETVDGLLLNHTFGAESDWSLSLDAYYGEYELIELQADDPTGQPLIATAEDVVGIQLWLNTPVLGLRFGLGGQQRDVTGGLEGLARPVGGATSFDDWYTSLEYLGEHWNLRAEYRDTSAVFGTPQTFLADATAVAYYAQVGYFFNEKFGIFLQHEVGEQTFDSATFTSSEQFDARTDQGIALNYRFNANLVLKAEYHEVDHELLAFIPIFGPSGFMLDPFTIPSDNGSYSILTFATSF